MEIPTHVAIVPDGNRRWAQLHGVSPLEGHQAGARAVHNVVDRLIRHKLECLTLWGFSTDNWKRTDEEVENIFRLLQQWIEKDTPWLHENKVRLRHIGHLQELPDGLRETITRSISLTWYNQGMTLNLAFNYSGRAEILDAVRRLVEDKVPYDLIDEHLFSSYLQSGYVDLVIRTAGEYRVSNVLLGQAAYAEYYFTETLWPDLNEEELDKALSEYSERKRRFGGD